jgi:chitinase
MVTSATWSVGAYGEGAFVEAAPQGSPYTGVAIRMLREVGDLLDQVQVMAYDAGDSYDAKIAFDAYRAVYSGKKELKVFLDAVPAFWLDK